MPFLPGAATQYGIGRIGFMPLLQGAASQYGIIFKRYLLV